MGYLKQLRPLKVRLAGGDTATRQRMVVSNGAAYYPLHG